MWFSSSASKSAWTQKASRHVEARNAALAIEFPPNAFDSRTDEAIISSDIASIVYGIQEKRWTALEVTQAFIRRAQSAHKETNCLTEVLFDQAIERAKELDGYFEKTGELIGPLHGVPISIKELIVVKGCRTTLGFTSWVDRPPLDYDGLPTVIMKHLGAIPFVKTNVPQTMMSFECNNPLWGRSTNPYNSANTPGGSSGGEGALLAAGGSALGLGTDIGGSLRIPAGYCGIYSLKPTARRWPIDGNVKYAEGNESVIAVPGPMARTAADLELVFRCFTEALYLGADHSDVEKLGEIDLARHEKLRRGLNTLEYMHQPVDAGWFEPLEVVKRRNKPLRIGYFFNDGFIATSPASFRALKEAVDAVKRKHSSSEVELVRLTIPDDLGGAEAIKIFLAMTSSDGHDRLTMHFGQDKPDQTLFLTLLTARFPMILRIIISFILRRVLGDWMMAMIMRASGRKSAGGFFSWVKRRDEFRREWLKRIWNENDLDAIVCPIQATPAIPHGASAKVSGLCASTCIFNVLEYPVACLPVTRVDTKLDSHVRGDSPEYNEWKSDKDLHRGSGLLNKALYIQNIYDAQKMAGLPVGLQVVTRPFQEEKAIGIMRLIDSALPPLSTRGGVKGLKLKHT